MKRLLSIIGAISLLGTSTTSLVACNTPQEYTKEELAKLKEENKIKTNNQEIRDNLEWIAPQEYPFSNNDNKYYYVVWKGNKDNDWIFSKFLNNTNKTENYIIDNKKEFSLIYFLVNNTNFKVDWTLRISGNMGKDNEYPLSDWDTDKFTYFKSVYRWNLTTQEPDLIIDDKGNVKVNGE